MNHAGTSATQQVVKRLLEHKNPGLAEEILATELTDVETLQYLTHLCFDNPTVTAIQHIWLLSQAVKSTNPELKSALQTLAENTILAQNKQKLPRAYRHLVYRLLQNPLLAESTTKKLLTQTLRIDDDSQLKAAALEGLATNPNSQPETLDMIQTYLQTHKNKQKLTEVAVALLQNPNISPNFLKNYILYPTRNPVTKQLFKRKELNSKKTAYWDSEELALIAAANPAANPKHVQKLEQHLKTNNYEYYTLLSRAAYNEKTIQDKIDQLTAPSTKRTKEELHKTVEALLQNPHTPKTSQKQLVDLFIANTPQPVLHHTIGIILQSPQLTGETLEYLWFGITPTLPANAWSGFETGLLIQHPNVTEKIVQDIPENSQFPKELYTVGCRWFKLENMAVAWEQTQAQPNDYQRHAECIILQTLAEGNYTLGQLQQFIDRCPKNSSLNLAVSCGLQILSENPQKMGKLFNTAAAKLYWNKLAGDYQIEKQLQTPAQPQTRVKTKIAKTTKPNITILP